MIKEVLLAILFILLLPNVMALNFSEYPEFFRNNKAIIIVGENALREDAISSVLISSSFQDSKKCIECFPNDNDFVHLGAKFSEQVSYVNSNNIIIGGPCANPFAARLLNIPTTWPECTQGFEKGKAKLLVVKEFDTIKVLIAGYDGLDTYWAARVLANYKENNLIGTELEIYRNSFGNLYINVIK